MTTRTAVYILLSGHCLERRTAKGAVKSYGGQEGGAKNKAKGSRGLSLSVGGEGGREGWMMPFHAKKRHRRSAGQPRSSSYVEKVAAATEYTVVADSAVVEATTCLPSD